MSNPTIADSDILIAEYTLGLLNPEETSQAQTLLGTDSRAAITALEWENHFLDLVDLLPATEPGPESLRQLQATLGHTITPAPAPSPSPVVRLVPTTPTPQTPAPRHTEDHTLTVAAALRTPEKPLEAPIPSRPGAATAATPTRVMVPNNKSAQAPKVPPKRSASNNTWLWRAASILFALIAATLAFILAQPVAPPVTIVEIAPTRAAVMQAPGQSSTPGWVVTVDPQGNVLMQPKVYTDIPSDASVQLWTHNPLAPQPRSLGLIDPNQPVSVPATLMGEIAQDQIFEMTQEPAGGSPTAGPGGPILFIGRIVTFGKIAIAPPVSNTSVPGDKTGS